MCERNVCEIVVTNPAEIEFIEDSHTYIVDGLILPSVSEIMRTVAMKYYANIEKAVLDKAADRGKRVHSSVELFEKIGVLPDDEIRPYLTQYKIAKKLKGFEPTWIEERLTNGAYCGTLDMIARYRGQPVIIDLKATSKINTELLEVQLAAYLELARYNGFDITECYCLHLKKDGFKFVEVLPNVPMWEQLKEDYGL